MKIITSSAPSLQREESLSWVGLDTRDMFWLLFGDLMPPPHTPITQCWFQNNQLQNPVLGGAGDTQLYTRVLMRVNMAGEPDSTSVKSPALGSALYFQMLLTRPVTPLAGVPNPNS